jgi:hypothetical protein
MRLLREEAPLGLDDALQLPREAGRQGVRAAPTHIRDHAAADHRRGE